MPYYKSYLVTYIDILGFRELIDSSKKAPREADRIYRLLKRLQQRLNRDPFKRSTLGELSPPVITVNFSDLILRARHCDSDSAVINRLQWELWFLANAQFHLLSQDLLLRGGICRDDLYIGKHVVFGPGLVKSYLLEQDYAIFPRVVVDRKLAETFVEKSQQWQMWLSRADDGVYFVDYLRAAWVQSFNECGGNLDLVAETFSTHCSAVRRLLRKGRKNRSSKVRQKYLWLGIYHNNRLQEAASQNIHPELGKLLENSKISDVELSF